MDDNFQPDTDEIALTCLNELSLQIKNVVSQWFETPAFQADKLLR